MAIKHTFASRNVLTSTNSVVLLPLRADIICREEKDEHRGDKEKDQTRTRRGWG